MSYIADQLRQCRRSEQGGYVPVAVIDEAIAALERKEREIAALRERVRRLELERQRQKDVA